ncbi:hypothetical protein C8F04DRAFT_1105893 [Mycena alexandri]|uniref:Uncharacterized protein n=1 Tax=Mycena alexandri TaxID=1745969 RepID=A0AAD6SSE6_9AGAR|nr:hypothetical protein C8F04DRAFT_1105893 [Mycena alexandri]
MQEHCPLEARLFWIWHLCSVVGGAGAGRRFRRMWGCRHGAGIIPRGISAQYSTRRAALHRNRQLKASSSFYPASESSWSPNPIPLRFRPSSWSLVFGLSSFVLVLAFRLSSWSCCDNARPNPCKPKSKSVAVVLVWS